MKNPSRTLLLIVALFTIGGVAHAAPTLARFGTGFALCPPGPDAPLRWTLAGPTHWNDATLALQWSAGEAVRRLDHESAEREVTPCGLTLSEQADDVRFQARWLAPFDPDDLEQSALPVIYLDLTLTSLASSPRSASVSLRFEDAVLEPLRRDRRLAGLMLETADGVLALAADSRLHNTIPTNDGFTWYVTLQPGETRQTTLMLAGFATPDRDVRLAHQRRVKRVNDILRRAMTQEQAMREATNRFEQAITGSSLPEGWSEVLSHALQDYLRHTWLVEARRTHRVVVNDTPAKRTPPAWIEAQAVFASQFQPGLLTAQLEDWLNDPPNDLPGDDARDLLLSWHTTWRMHGEQELLRRHGGTLPNLVAALDHPVVRQAGPGRLYAATQELVHLALGRIAALSAAAELARSAGQADKAAVWAEAGRAEMARIDEAGWMGDHYAPRLNPNIRGWNGYATTTSMHLLLPLRSALKLPTDTGRLAYDMQQAAYRCRAVDETAVTTLRGLQWPLANLRRDLAGGYLGYIDEQAGAAHRNVLDELPAVDSLVAFTILESLAGLRLSPQARALCHGAVFPGERFSLPALSPRLSELAWLRVDDHGNAVPDGPDQTVKVTQCEPTALVNESAAPSDVSGVLRLFWGRGDVAGPEQDWSADELGRTAPIEVLVWYMNIGESAHDVQLFPSASNGWQATLHCAPRLEAVGPHQPLLARITLTPPPEEEWDRPARLDIEADVVTNVATGPSDLGGGGEGVSRRYQLVASLALPAATRDAERLSAYTSMGIDHDAVR